MALLPEPRSRAIRSSIFGLRIGKSSSSLDRSHTYSISSLTRTLSIMSLELCPNKTAGQNRLGRMSIPRYSSPTIDIEKEDDSQVFKSHSSVAEPTSPYSSKRDRMYSATRRSASAPVQRIPIDLPSTSFSLPSRVRSPFLP